MLYAFCRDLKRDIAKKLSRLDKHTQQAIAELTRKRIVAEQGGVDLASALLRQRKRRMNPTQTELLFLLVSVTVCTMS